MLQTTKLMAPLRVIHETQPFGVNRGMYAIYGMIGHNGRDFRTVFNLPNYKTPKGNIHVFAMADGVVSEVGDQDIHRANHTTIGVGYGKFIRLEHPDGSQTIYGHLSIQLVKVGQKVNVNTIMGLTGNTGKSTGSHLHVGYRPPKWTQIYDNGFKGYTNFDFIPR